MSWGDNFPLDEQLQLRSDSWSGGAARVMTRCELREPSFEQAAEGYRGQVSGASVRRVTQGFGQQVREQHSAEAARAARVGAFEEFPHERWLPLEQSLMGIGNVYSDSTVILIREEGWKEVKAAAFSQVTTLPPHHPDRRALQRDSELAELYRSSTSTKIGNPEIVRQAPGYFQERMAEMRYADFRAAGYPIGSGTVESAARNVVQPRMRRPGRGWAREKAAAMLMALAEFHSGRLHSTWQRVYAAG